MDRLQVIELALQQDGFAPETLRALELILEELHYLRDRSPESAMELAGAVDACSRAHDRNSAIPRIERMVQEFVKK